MSDGHSTQPGMHALLPRGFRIGRYVIERHVGSGGMASVYAALHEDLDKRVALKTLHPSLALHEPSVERFLAEARSASRLNHPNVVSVMDAGRVNQVPYLVMEYLDGESLADQLDRLGPYALSAMGDVMLPVVSAVRAAHNAGIIHRDLKPENIFLARDGQGNSRPVLLDFGISKLRQQVGVPSNLTMAGEIMGTPHYMAPEMIRSPDAIDERIDQYALGVILYELATGVRPFRADKSLYLLLAEITFGNPQLPTQLRPSLPVAFERVILKAMANNRDERYPTLQAMGRALARFASPAVRANWEHEFGELESHPTPSVAMRAVRNDTNEMPKPAVVETAEPMRVAVQVPPAHLRAIKALSECGEAELDMLCVAAPAYRYPAGSVLFQQGAPGESCFMLLSGSVDVVKSLPSGNTLLNTLEAGAIAGQLALVDRSPRSASVVARTEVYALELGYELFHRLLAAHSPFAMRFQIQIAISGIRQLRKATERFSDLLERRARIEEGRRTITSDEFALREGLEHVRLAAQEWSVPLDTEARGVISVRPPKPTDA